MRYKLKEAPREELAIESQCRHYWVIESASGPTSYGVCKFCGAARAFYNSLSEATHLGRSPRVFELPELEIEPKREQDESELAESNVTV